MNTKKIANMPMPAPQPEPAFKVGDWLTDGDVTGCVSELCGSECLWIDATDGASYHINLTNARKLKPSGVVIHIGCLSGTVTYAISDDCFLLAKVNDPQHRACCIDMSMLDAPTRELVKALLKAQEGETLCHS